MPSLRIKARRKTVRWDADQHARNLDEHQALFSEEWLAQAGSCGHPSTAPIFIVGLPRAGSTLLEQILASHSMVEGTMELPDIISIARRLSRKQLRSDASRYPSILGRMGADKLAELGPEYLRRTEIYRSTTPYFIDKMPNNFAHIGLIHLLLPNARIIDARRYSMACCFSAYKQLFASGQNFSYSQEEIGRYYRDYVRFMDHWDRVLPGRVLRVDYEDMVADTEAEVRRMLDHCGLAFQESCLGFYRNDRAVRTASSEQVRQPIYADAVEQWRHYESHLTSLKDRLDCCKIEFFSTLCELISFDCLAKVEIASWNSAARVGTACGPGAVMKQSNYSCVAYDFSDCTDPRIQYENDSTFERSSIELRLQSKSGNRLRWVAGLFYNDDRHEYFNQWIIPTIPDGNDIPLDRNINARENLYFATNQEREASELAVFGEVTFDVTDQLSATLGARWFETEDKLTGFVGSRFSCFDPADGNRIGNGTATSANCGGGLGAKIDDFTGKISLSYRVNDDVMVYATYSEGFRPGGVNREPGPLIPQICQPDFLKNYEVGWKTGFADGRARFNGAAYVTDWEDLQLTRFDVENFGSFLGLTANTSGADITGTEGDFEVRVSESWTLSDDSWNDLFVNRRARQSSYGLLNLSGGVAFGDTNLSVYVNNATDENAELTRFSRGGDERIVANRPRSAGLSLSMRF